MTGLNDSRLLIASHIIPWNENANNRLNPRNGLCLSALHHLAFDCGLITVTSDMDIMISSSLNNNPNNNFHKHAFHSLQEKKLHLQINFSPILSF